MEHVVLYLKIYQTVNRNPETFNVFGKMCAKKNTPIPKSFDKVKAKGNKFQRHFTQAMGISLVQKYQNKYVNV